MKRLLIVALMLAGCSSGSSAVHGAPVATTTTMTSPSVGGTTPTTTTRPTSPTSTTIRSTSATSATQGSGVRGTVTAGPTCPVERVGNPCPPKPVQTGLRLRSGGGAVVATGASAGDGTFSIAAPAGSYTLEAIPGSNPYPRCPTVPVNVAAGSYTVANMTCDTGIR